ncbi:tripartite tricarboxylate transporter substrate-binding protein [Mameliella sp.]|uniref:tripartite tricarboxylate transporter substrate-binding protein n=1 Tax=Mameliella sp. TaxID=1924940 RepID=UPI003BA967AD
MKFAMFKSAAAALAMITAATGAQAQDWEPQGPVKMMIAFAAGGGADTLGRLLAEEISSRYGWEIIPENVTGKGGVTMAVALKNEPADGTSVGITVSEATTYAPQTMRTPPYALEDFTFLSTLAGTQMGIIAKPSRGWKTLADVIAAAKAGERITVGAMSQQLADATYVLGKNNGVDFTTVMTGGGKASLNAVVADDVDIGWSAGAQTAAVKAGEITNLASAEIEPLLMQPDAPQVQDFNLPYDFGVKFIVVAPAGIPEEARETWQHHIAEILNDPESKLAQFTNRAFAGPVVVQGAELETLMRESYDAATRLLDASAE